MNGNEEQTCFVKIFNKIQSSSKEHYEEEILKDYFNKSFDSLVSRMQISQGKKNSSISKSIFSSYLNLPMIVSDRIFEAFGIDQEEREFLKRPLFLNGMHKLFFGSLQDLEKMAFRILDVGLKGEIIKEDVELLFTYLNNTCENPMRELDSIVNTFFNFNTKIDYEMFVHITENTNSNIFILLLTLIYSRQPFNREVLQFFNQNCTHPKIAFVKETENKHKRKETIVSPSKEIMFCIKNLAESFPIPKRKDATKNILNILIEESHNRNEANNSDEESDSDKLEFTQESTQNESKGEIDINSTVNLGSDIKYFTSSVYEMSSCSKSTKSIDLSTIVLVNNNLFSFKIYRLTNQSVLTKVHPLSGCLITSCEEVTIQNITFYPFAILSQYGNTLAHIDNVFLCLSDQSCRECIGSLQLNMGTRILHDHYEIFNKIGKGVFGVVNLGVNKRTLKKVAIKKIDKNKLIGEHFGMVKYEVDIMKFLINSPHPDIITPLEIFEDKYYIYYVLEYMSGGTLKNYMKEAKKLNEENSRKVIRKITNAMSFLNKIGVIHRDIKTENILLHEEDLSSAKLSDFGLSTIKFTNQRAHEACGTLFYSAPELLLNYKYNSKVDIWSLGVLTYHLLTGCYPFEGVPSHKKELMLKICQEKLTFSSRHELSKLTKYFIVNCLNKNPSERFDIDKVLRSEFIAEL